jgi:hypothetical protein
MTRKPRRDEQDLDEEELDDGRPEWPALRRKVEDYSPDPADWLAPHHMSATETSLRLARWLLAGKLVVSDIHVALTGHELTRRNTPRFPVERFLAERAVSRLDRGAQDDWQGRYLLQGASHALRLHSDRDEGDVVATLVNGRRLVAQVSRGVVGETRSPAEHRMLRGVIGRAVTFEHYEPSDWGAAVVPRNARFRQLAARWRHTPPMERTGLLILTVDRVGTVDGFPPELMALPITGRPQPIQTEEDSWRLSS